jgi:hypothetical protein
MANSLSDLSTHLFAQLDRLAGNDLTSEQVDTEAARAEAIVALSDQILKGSALQINAAKLFAEHGAAVLPHLPLIGKRET